MTDTTTLRADKPVPLGIALGLMGVILLGGGVLIWHYLYRPGRPRAVMHVTVPSPANPRVAGGLPTADAQTQFNVIQTAAEADLPDGPNPGPAGEMLFKAGDAYLRITPDEPEPRYTYGYFTVKDVEWEHGYISQGIRRILTQEEFAREIGISDDQRKRLEELPQAPSTKWPQADRDGFIKQYHVWAAANGDARVKAGAELVGSLKAFAEKKRAADLKAMADRVIRAKAILTGPQIARINPIPKWDIKTTQPTGK